MTAAVALALGLAVPAAAGAAGPPVALVASPSHLSLAAGAAATVRVTNTGSDLAVVDVARAAFALDLRGRPRVVARRQRWVSVRPRRLTLAGGATASVTVRALLPPQAEPGDHPQLLLLTTRAPQVMALPVRVRLGVVVDVRAPGRIVHHVVVLRVRSRPSRRLEVLLANRGNVTESVGGRCLALSIYRGARLVLTLRAHRRRLLPRAPGLLDLRYPARVRGPVTVRVALLPRCGGLGASAFALAL